MGRNVYILGPMEHNIRKLAGVHGYTDDARGCLSCLSQGSIVGVQHGHVARLADLGKKT